MNGFATRHCIAHKLMSEKTFMVLGNPKILFLSRSLIILKLVKSINTILYYLTDSLIAKNINVLINTKLHVLNYNKYCKILY